MEKKNNDNILFFAADLERIKEAGKSRRLLFDIMDIMMDIMFACYGVKKGNEKIQVSLVNLTKILIPQSIPVFQDYKLPF